MDNSNLPPELLNNIASQDPENSSDACGERSPLDTLTENSGSAEPTNSIFSSKSADPHGTDEYTPSARNLDTTDDATSTHPGVEADMRSGILEADMQSGISETYMRSGISETDMQSGLSETYMRSGVSETDTSKTDFILVGDPSTPETDTEGIKSASSYNYDPSCEQIPSRDNGDSDYDQVSSRDNGDPSYEQVPSRDTDNADHANSGYAITDHNDGAYAYSDYKNANRGFYGSRGAAARPGGISKKFFIVSLIVAMLLTSAVTTLGMILYTNNFSEGSDRATNYTLSKESKSLPYDSIVHKVNSSVVSIVTESVSTDTWAQNYVKKGAGSGVIIQKNGYILTCNHVIQNASKIRVNMSNDKSYPAKLVASSPDDDLAVLKISANGLNAATYGDSSKLEVGDQVIAIGNPLGQLSNTASTGIISALNRQLTIENRKLNLLQTDASINPGNSGGALFNSSGNLIGIVVAKSAGSDVEGLGFAIPINHAAEIAKKLIKDGDIKSKTESSGQGALIGVTIQDLGKDQARSGGFDDGGVFIISVTSPYARKAGLQSRDRIYSLGGKLIKDSAALKSALSKYKAGDKVNVVVVRNNKKISAKVTLIAASQTPQ